MWVAGVVLKLAFYLGEGTQESSGLASGGATAEVRVTNDRGKAGAGYTQIKRARSCVRICKQPLGGVGLEYGTEPVEGKTSPPPGPLGYTNPDVCFSGVVGYESTSPSEEVVASPSQRDGSEQGSGTGRYERKRAERGFPQRFKRQR